MADSTTNIPQMSSSQASKEITFNAAMDAASPAMLYGRNSLTTTALTWGYIGGRFNGTAIANGTVALTASNTNYVVAARSTGAVSVATTTTNWDDRAAYVRLYKVVTGTATISSYEDHRDKEPIITAGTSAQYFRGDKTWRDFATDVRATVLAGLSTAAGTVVTAAHTVLEAIGFLQKQVSDNKTTADTHIANTSNPHSVTKTQVGLGNVDNTSDASKPVSTAQQTALDLKADKSNTVRVLGQSAVAASVTGTLTETVFATVVIPANTLGANGGLRITTTWSMTNNANTKNARTKFGGTNIFLAGLTTSATYKETRDIINRNSTNSQVFFAGAFGGMGVSGTSIGTMAKDTTASQNVEITGQLTNIADTLTLESYIVELIKS